MREWTKAAVAAALIGGLAACGGTEEMASVTVPTVEDVTAAEWQRLREQRFFFGHQSVGADVLNGVADVLKARPDLGLRVVETTDTAQMTVPGLYHAKVGRNGEPQSKLDEFVRLAGAGVADSGTAMLKYCYVDITGATDPDSLFETYRKAVDALRASNPGLRIVHLTLPLQKDWGTVQHLYVTIKGGRTTHRELNWIRQRYNERLRATYGGKEPVFDIALLESIGPDGRQRTARFRGERVPVLADEWTYDGGHLNEAGRRRIGEAFLATLAKL